MVFCKQYKEIFSCLKYFNKYLLLSTAMSLQGFKI